jgi:2,3-bisphosphoglycerate-dependent phosphoglycerate mutase
MRTTLYFIRHAKSDFKIKEDAARPLTIAGHRAAQKLIADFSNTQLHAIYSSPYKRTIDTVKPLATSKKLPIIERELLRERSIGKWVEDFNSYARKQWDDFDFKIDGGESLRAVQNRNINQLTEILENHDGENIAIGTHGTSLSTILNYFDESFDYNSFLSIADKMPLIVVVEFQRGTFHSYRINESGHV